MQRVVLALVAVCLVFANCKSIKAPTAEVVLFLEGVFEGIDVSILLSLKYVVYNKT